MTTPSTGDEARRLENLWAGEFGDAYVDRNAEAFFSRLDFGEILQPQSKLRKLGRRNSRERIAGIEGPLLPPGHRAGDGEDENKPQVPDDRSGRSNAGGHLAVFGAVGSSTITTPCMKSRPAPHIRLHSIL